MPVEFTVRPNITQIEKRYRPSYRKKVNASLLKMTKAVKKNIYNEAPKRTGNLRKSIVVRTRRVYIHEVTIDQRRKGAKYEPFVRLGVRPRGGERNTGYIYPKRKKALWWPGLSHPIAFVGPPITRKPPGQKANNYFERGVELSEPDIQKYERQIGTEIIRSIG